jgi:DNA-binding NarL/FixJ family response regulator
VTIAFTSVASRGDGKDDVREDERAVVSVRPRVCVVDSGHEPVYEHLDECAIDVMAVVPRLSDVDPALLRNFDIVLIGCNDSLLLNRGFERRASRLASLTRLVGVAAQPAPETLAHAARLGFRGFLAREVSPPAFARTLDAVLDGDVAFPRAAFAALAGLLRVSAFAPSRGKGASLTEREGQVVALIAAGAHDREIAQRLRISLSTVQKHVQNAMRRTKAKTRSELVASARRSSRRAAR